MSEATSTQRFEEACLALLRETLVTAGLLSSDPPSSAGTGASITRSSSEPIAILDVGIGCGDQTLALACLLQRPRVSPRDFRYVGLTLSASQLQHARTALDRRILASKSSDSSSKDRGMKNDSSHPSHALEHSSFSLLCANAAKPRAWNATVKQAVGDLADERYKRRWLLGLDCLYHFSPSRRPLLEYTARDLGADFMAFDLLLNEHAPVWDRFRARIIGVMMGCPFGTFMSEDEYRRQLVECGFDNDTIVIRDISRNVFAGASRHLQQQEDRLRPYGISIGGFKLAGRLFGWFDRSKVVKGVIVVARSKAPGNQGLGSKPEPPS
jgi:hypothetical protein